MWLGAVYVVLHRELIIRSKMSSFWIRCSCWHVVWQQEYVDFELNLNGSLDSLWRVFGKYVNLSEAKEFYACFVSGIV